MITAGLTVALTAAQWLTLAKIAGGVSTFCFTIAPEVARIKAKRAARKRS